MCISYIYIYLIKSEKKNCKKKRSDAYSHKSQTTTTKILARTYHTFINKPKTK